jgi:rhamnosyltransferase subunit B
MNVLVCSFGSFGDVHPFVGLALALQVRGHHVTVAINGYFRELVERVGLEFVELGAREEYLEQAAHPDLWHPQRSFAYLFRTGVNRVMRQQYP